jgi:hypothetical protein
MKTLIKYFSPDKAASVILYFSILAFIIAFNFSDNPKSGWNLQLKTTNAGHFKCKTFPLILENKSTKEKIS